MCGRERKKKKAEKARFGVPEQLLHRSGRKGKNAAS